MQIKQNGLMTSEIVTYIIVAAILIAVGFGMFVSSERNGMVDRAQTSISAIKERSEALTAGGKPLVCNNGLVDQDVLANDYLSLNIKPILVDEENHSSGFGPGLHVKSSKEEDSPDTWTTAVRLYEAIKEDDETRLRELIKDDEKIEYFVLISDANCVDQAQVSSTTNPNG